MKYFYPYTNKEDNFHDNKWKRSEEYEQAVCWKCNSISVEHTGKPLDIVVRREPKIFDPPHPGAEIVPVQYANFLKQHDLEKRIIWGSVLIGKKREKSDNYLTAYMPSSNTFHERGNKKSRYNMCHLCGRRSSSMTECGEEYLLEYFCDYPVFFLGGRSCPVLSESIVSLYDWGQHAGVKFQEFPVCKCPLDGFRLPGDPDWADICPDFKPNRRKNWED